MTARAMPHRTGIRWGAGVPVLAYLGGAVVQVVLSTDPPAITAVTLVALAVPVALGSLIAARVPGMGVGAALAWVGGAPSVVFGVEFWGASALTSDPWPGAGLVRPVSLGAWVWNLAGFVALCLVFPGGLLPGPRWRVVVGGCLGAAVLMNGVIAAADTGGAAGPVGVALLVCAYVGYLAAVAAAVASLVVRYRRGEEVVRQQLRWLVLGAAAVPLLLTVGWFLQWRGAPPGVAFVWFLSAMVLAVPAAVAIAVLRYDLFDVDRLLGASLAWLLTTVVSAVLFAAAVVGAVRLGTDSRLGAGGAAFITALVLAPLHRWFSVLAGQVVDRDRYVIGARLRQFVQDVRDGRADPEQTEGVLRGALADPGLALVLRTPGQDGDYVNPTGEVVALAAGATVIPLRSGTADVGALVLGASSARRVRRAREAARELRLPIEVSRLRLGLREALRQVQASRERLVEAATRERRRLERDLHDGAQQQIVAAGMRLRSVQSRFAGGTFEHEEIEAAVATLQHTVVELRRIAHGVRPSLLDDGLSVALRALVADSPVPVHLRADDVDATDTVRTTLYFVVAEAYTNALKHAAASQLWIDVRDSDGFLTVEVRDDGVGGADPRLTGMRDRVASVGGRLAVHSPRGEGTTVTVEVPDAHRRRG